MSKITFSSYTFKGRRGYNQDYLASEQIDDKIWIFAVADGMGGANGGELASYKAIHALIGHISDNRENISSETLKQNLQDAVKQAHEAINNEIEKDSKLAGMGTTLVCILVYEDSYAWTSIGDSRIYYITEEEVKLLTTDHSYVQDYMNTNGKTLPKDVLDNYSHILTRCIDGSMEESDVYPKKEKFQSLQKGDAFLLCSDGLLTDRINTNVNLFKNFVLGEKNLDKAARNLVGYAYEMGSDDNISVVLLRNDFTDIHELKLKEYKLPDEARSDEKSNLIKRIFNKKNSI